MWSRPVVDALAAGEENNCIEAVRRIPRSREMSGKIEVEGYYCENKIVERWSNSSRGRIVTEQIWEPVNERGIQYYGT